MTELIEKSTNEPKNDKLRMLYTVLRKFDHEMDALVNSLHSFPRTGGLSEGDQGPLTRGLLRLFISRSNNSY